MKYFIYSLVMGLLVIPSLSFAQQPITNPNVFNGIFDPNNTSTSNGPASSSGFSCSPGGNPKLQDLADYGVCIINHSIIPLIFAIAIVMFIWGVVQYVMNGTDEEAKAKGRQFMLWGIIALTVMLGVWGLVGILGATFGVDTSVFPQVGQ